jgi:hypothetical protein
MGNVVLAGHGEQVFTKDVSKDAVADPADGKNSSVVKAYAAV